MKNQFIRDLKPGNIVDSIFLLVKKIIRKKKNGEDYYMLSFQDKSGIIDGIIWTEACINLGLFKKGNFEEGNFVKVQGMVSDYRGSRQLDINKLARLNDDDEKQISKDDFIRTAKRDTDEMFAELRSLTENFKNIFLRTLINSFFNDNDFVKNFCFSPAAVQYHHAYVGGLLEHTLSMVKICSFLSKNYENIDSDLLITGAILHDVGKIKEYATEKNGAIIKITDEGKLLGHITIGYGIILNKIEVINNFPKDLKDRLLHIILSHHGHKEFGSPKRPKTLEAFIVYHVDHMDADIGGFNFIIENSEASAEWSEYLKNFERSVFLKAPDYISDSLESGSVFLPALDDKVEYGDPESNDETDNDICIVNDESSQDKQKTSSGNFTDKPDNPGKEQNGLF